MPLAAYSVAAVREVATAKPEDFHPGDRLNVPLAGVTNGAWGAIETVARGFGYGGLAFEDVVKGIVDWK
jgi:hypothetical protein